MSEAHAHRRGAAVRVGAGIGGGLRGGRRRCGFALRTRLAGFTCGRAHGHRRPHARRFRRGRQRNRLIGLRTARQRIGSFRPLEPPVLRFRPRNDGRNANARLLLFQIGQNLIVDLDLADRRTAPLLEIAAQSLLGFGVERATFIAVKTTKSPQFGLQGGDLKRRVDVRGPRPGLNFLLSGPRISISFKRCFDALNLGGGGRLDRIAGRCLHQTPQAGDILRPL